MARRGETFPEEERPHGSESPGVIEDEEALERRLPPETRETTSGSIPDAAFPRRELQWTEDEGGASVDRSWYAEGGVTGHRGARGTIRAKAGDIRRQTDAEGNRLWSVTDKPVPENHAHAEIQREPRGRMPSRKDRSQLMEVWRGAIASLTRLRREDPKGRPVLELVPHIGMKIQWRSGRNETPKDVARVESVAEAVRAYVGAGILTEKEAQAEQQRLEQELAAGTQAAQDTYSEIRPGR